MADREISTLPAAEALTDDALFVGDFGGEAQKFSGEQLKEYVSLNVVSAEAQTLPEGSDATAQYSPQTRKLTLGIPQGVTPNISIGTVTTLPAGSAADVTITGTAEAPVLNLSLPQGEDGVSPDKDEIVQEVLEALPTWSGGEF